MNSIVLSYHLKLFKEESVITGMLQNGLSHFHLRKPDLNINEYRKIIELIPAEFHKRIVLHSHFELLNEFDLKGYYITSSERGVVAEPQGNHIRSTFANSFDELENLDGKYDYFLMGPIFKSISKPNLTVKFNHEYLRSEFNSRQLRSKVLAIGGIRENSTEMAINYGFDGVVILGAVWALYMETFDIRKAVDQYVSINNVAVVMKN
ncbi:MAG: thiamine phosphate synthase [Bacteroidales bacterium]|nr:thiamine phosphate synthase [Bacteroidales bacterium]